MICRLVKYQFEIGARIFFKSLSVILFTIFFSYSQAATITWDGDAADGEWTTAANWSGDVLPTSSDDVIINNGDAVTLSSGTVSIHTIFLDNGSDFIVGAGATLNVNNSGSGNTFSTPLSSSGIDVTNNGTINVSGGADGIRTRGVDWTNNAGASINISSFTSDGFEDRGNGSFNNYGSISVIGGFRGIYTFLSLTNQSTGIINVENTISSGLRVASNAVLTNWGAISVNGGGNSLEVNKLINQGTGTIAITNPETTGIYSSISFENAGAITITGGNGQGIYMADVDYLNSGTITISGTNGYAFDFEQINYNNTFSNTGILQGVGTFDMAGETLDGTIIPGTSPGAMTYPVSQIFSASSTIEIEVNGTTAGTQHDQIVVTGTATIGGTLNATVGYTALQGDRIEILTATAISGTFSTVNLPNDWEIEYSATKVELVYEYTIGKWDGEAGDGLWGNAENWEGAILPTASTDVIINNGDAVTLSSGTVSIHTIFLDNESDFIVGVGATLNVNNTGSGNTFSTPNSPSYIDITNNGTINISGGTDGINTRGVDWINNAGASINISSFTGDGFEDRGIGSFNNYGSISVIGGFRGIYTFLSLTNQSTGTINVENTISSGLRVASNAVLTNWGAISVNGGGNSLEVNKLINQGTGTIAITNAVTTGIYSSSSFENAGAITITGGNGQGIYLADVDYLNSGTITISGTNGYAFDFEQINYNNTFSNTGILQGVGTFDMAGETLDGTIVPGTSPGIMTYPVSQTFSASSTIEVEINGTTAGTQHDQIVVNGTTTISGTLNPTINYTPTGPDRIVIISATAISGTFSSINPALPAYWTLDYSVAGEVALVYSYNDGLWDGDANDGLWTTAANWDGDVLPSSSTDVVINNGNLVTLSNSTTTVKSITLENGSDLTVASGSTDLTISGFTGFGLNIPFACTDCVFTNNGSVTITGGTHGIYSGSPIFNNTGAVLNISGSSTIAIYAFSNFTNSGGMFTSGPFSSGAMFVGGDLINNISGVLNISNPGQKGIDTDGANSTNHGTIKVSGSCTSAIEAINLVNTGSIESTGASNRSLFINDSFDDINGTIQGTGNFELGGTFVPLELNGKAEPGGSAIGVMTFINGQTFAATSTIEVDVAGTTAGTNHDQIVVNGTATLGGTLDASIIYTPTNGDRIIIISATAISGTFSTINPALPADWSIDYSVVGEVALVYSGVLPVELIAFDAYEKEKEVVLSWQTATEINNSHFEVNWSTDGLNFEKIGEVSGAGNSMDINFYEFVHARPQSGVNYYQLKQVDFDGEFDNSNIISINIEVSNSGSVKVYPNPASDYLFIEGLMENEIVQIININGQVVKEFTIQSLRHEESVHQLQSGLYFLKTKRETKELVVH